MLWHQSLKSIHYRILLIFQTKKTTDLRVKTWGGIKDMLSPPCQNMGGIHTPHPPRDLRPCLGHSACCISPSHQCSNIPSCCMSIYYNLVILKLNNNPLIVVCTLVNHYVDNLVSRATCTKTCVGVVSRQAGDIYHKTILQPYVFNVCCYTCRPTFIYTMEFFVVNDFIITPMNALF